MTQQQQELPLVRPRRALVEETEVVELRVPRRVALAVEANPEGAVQALEKAAQRSIPVPGLPLELGLVDARERTKWSTQKPAIGLWEVTDAKTGTLLALWWFGGVWWITASDPARPGVGGIHHDNFVRQYAWRGLAQKPAQPYDCPPYCLRTVPKGCELNSLLAAPRAPERVALIEPGDERIGE